MCFKSVRSVNTHKSCSDAIVANSRKCKLQHVAIVRTWCRKHPQSHTVPEEELQVIFSLAKLALQGRDIRVPV